MTTLQTLKAQGFAASYHLPFTKQFKVKCEQCDALVINGVPSHERGCPDAMHECKGCNALIPTGWRFCGDCS